MDTLNTETPQDDQAVGINDAISQIKQWQTEGKTEDAIEGCKEILEIDPGNQDVKNILAELEKAPPVTDTPVIQPVETPQPEVTETPVATPTPEPVTPAEPAIAETPKTEVAPSTETNEEEPNPAENPLYTLDTKPAETPQATPTVPEKKNSHGILLNLAMLLIVALLIGGGIYIYLNYFQSEEETPTVEENIEEEITEEVITEEPEIVIEEETTDKLTQNEERLEDLAYIETKLKSYYNDNHMYPSANDLETELGTLPTDPVDEGEFRYSYAVYDNDLGKNQDYILAGAFEEETGEFTIWTTGASPQDHADYRDDSLENVTYISEDEISEEVVENTSIDETEEKVKVKRK